MPHTYVEELIQTLTKDLNALVGSAPVHSKVSHFSTGSKFGGKT